ncbi:hypothetical protein BC943DRAFT_364059 [Umbelopsis sp. AD052]|nr:hypothetical protein BC943DRAFT_364059 [Umbelopsis sp. AD052]
MSGKPFSFADYPVIIGIDFGTTFSGCCYAFAQNEEVIDIVKWPRQHNQVYPKTPTLSLYRRGSPELLDWGHGARRTAMKPNSTDLLLLSKFKLYLDENLHQESLPNGLSVLDVIADYLRVFHQHVCGELQKTFASNYTQDHYRYCLTVPAMWSDRAKSTMREAAIRAGLVSRSDHPDRLMLISEPEAAALYCEKKSEQFNLVHGQRFMICDAGGGTVDLIVFEIDQPEGGKRTLKEVTKGHGGSCGSGFLDMRMREYIKNKFSHHGNINESALENVMDSFVNLIKPEFDGYEDHFLQLPASMGLGDLTDEDIGLENGSLHLPAEELRDYVFEPVVSQVLALIDGQLNQSPNLEAIFLVGGFGQSNYLFRRVEEVFANRVGMIGVPPRGELAVVRGAVYFGLNPQIVTERVSRRTYGVETRMLYQPGLDPIEYSVVGADNRLFCRQRFSVYVHKGQSVKVDECISKNFVISYPNDTDSDLYAFDGDGPAPRLTTHHLVKKVSQFPIRMPSLDGVKPGDKVNMTIRMFFGLTEIKIECVIRDKIFVFTSSFDALDSFANAQVGTPSIQNSPLRHTQAFVPSPSTTHLPLGTPQTGSAYPAYPSPGAPMLPSSNLPQQGYGGAAPQQEVYGAQQQDMYGTPQQQSAPYPPMNQGYPPQQQQPNYYRQSTYDSYQQPQGGYYNQDGYGSPAAPQGGRRTQQQQQQQQQYPPY